MTSPSELTLYELAGADPALRFSPYCWKTRMALAHKGLAANGIAWRFTEKDKIAFSGQGRVPVLVDGATTVSDSWKIALYLEEKFSDRPSLFGSKDAVALTQFVNAWADLQVMPLIARIVVADVYNVIDEKDKAYFRQSREQRFGMSLEAFVADRSRHLKEFRAALLPMRQVLKERDYLAGDRPAYADYCVFGALMWARCTCAIDLLEADDPVFSWRERLLDAFDGLARRAPSIQC